MRKKIWMASGAVVVVALGAYLFVGGNDKETPAASDTSNVKQLVHSSL